MTDSTPATLEIVAAVPTKSVTVSSTPPVFTFIAIPAEPEPGGGTDVAGAGAGMTLSLTLAMG